MSRRDRLVRQLSIGQITVCLPADTTINIEEMRMANYLFIYRNSTSQQEKEFSPEQMQNVMEAWNQWIGKGFEDGWMVSPGDALQLDGKVINEEKVISDGPFAESKEIVGGFSIVQANGFDEACEIAKTCPAADTPTGSIEIRELAGLAPSK